MLQELQFCTVSRAIPGFIGVHRLPCAQVDSNKQHMYMAELLRRFRHPTCYYTRRLTPSIAGDTIMTSQIQMPQTEAVELKPRADDLGPVLRDIAFVLHLTRRV